MVISQVYRLSLLGFSLDIFLKSCQSAFQASIHNLFTKDVLLKLQPFQEFYKDDPAISI